MEQSEKIIDTLVLENGFDIDLDEGWTKLISSQFGGKPGRAFSELIQNAIDSYPPGTPWNERKGAIIANRDSISITDWGEGLDSKRLSLLATAGGTDKFGNPEKIGRFGLGFISIFNPQLGTTRVEVLTKCEGSVVEMIFTVSDPQKRPEIFIKISDKSIEYSTRIAIYFNNNYSANECAEFARGSLNYYPCPMTINGNQFSNEWQCGKTDSYLSFSENNCEGLIRKSKDWYNAKILCKYELVMNTTLSHFITGGHNMKYNLEDYDQNSTPYIQNVDVLFNINNLNLVISRDSYYLDWNYNEAKRLLNRKLRYFLFLEMKDNPKSQVIIANQYIYRHEIRDFLANPQNPIYDREEQLIIRLLGETPVYRINGRPGVFSLIQLKNMLHDGTPFYYSPEKNNLRWLGGSFKHDYIVIPEVCTIISGAPLLYDRLFEAIFKDVVNLDGILINSKKIQDLVERGLVNKSALSPGCKIVGNKSLSKSQKETIDLLSRILSDENILDIISRNLQIPVNSIKPVFFFVKEEGVYLSTGLFDVHGKPVSEDFISNILESPAAKKELKIRRTKVDLLLGLNMEHPFINYLVESSSSQKEYYTLTYLAHELSLSQKMLVPYSPFYHLVKEKLAQEMRKALIKNLLLQSKN